ncbi:MAG TPA: enoyl-CoA hydratase/isomerase family protein, partial [Acidimicrobiia bacterium]|nr:enoyl-CoA hydratase/isomerase family protein [Acidimicrobiia bacterium]
MGDLLVERGDGVARLTLNRPEKKNALSIALRDEISVALDAIAADGSVKCVVFTGAGNVFCAGFDLSEFPRSFDDQEYSDLLWASSDRYHHAVLECPVPTIAAVNGPALAGGFDLAVLCDIRIATTNAGFAHPEFTFGDVVYGPLHDLVGGAVARDLCLTGRALTAEQALRVNLVSAVVAEAALGAAVDEIVARIVQAPRELLMRTKAKANARARIAT